MKLFIKGSLQKKVKVGNLSQPRCPTPANLGILNPLNANYVNLRVCEIRHAYVVLDILRFPNCMTLKDKTGGLKVTELLRNSFQNLNKII